ncbi:hypothetical protein ACTPEF_27355, partial [Clostridioides difficile]
FPLRIVKTPLANLKSTFISPPLILKSPTDVGSSAVASSTTTARSMVTKYGMSSKLGPMSFDSDDEVFLGNSFSSKRNYSEEV